MAFVDRDNPGQTAFASNLRNLLKSRQVFAVRPHYQMRPLVHIHGPVLHAPHDARTIYVHHHQPILAFAKDVHQPAFHE